MISLRKPEGVKLRIGLSPEVDAIITTAIYAVIVAAMLLIPYFLTEYVKGVYRKKAIFESARRSKYNWPVILFFAAVWGVPIAIAVAGRLLK